MPGLPSYPTSGTYREKAVMLALSWHLPGGSEEVLQNLWNACFGQRYEHGIS
jgi:hypothetical protein